MYNKLAILLLWFRYANSVLMCDFKSVYKADDIYRGGQEWTYWFKSSEVTEGFSVDIDVPENVTNTWVDALWSYGGVRGRVSVFGDVVIFRKGLESKSSFNLSLVFGRGMLVDIPVRVKLYGQYESSTCTMGKVNQTPPTIENSNRIKRDVELPRWVGLHEVQSADYAFVWPVLTKYGKQGLALAAGADVNDGHEYIQLSQYERPVYALAIIGMFVAGPTYPALPNVGGDYFQGRQLFRYSKRDAAWLMWDFKLNKPAWNGDHGEDYWIYRACAVPIQHPGLVFDHTQSL